VRERDSEARPVDRALSIEGLYELFGRNSRLFAWTVGAFVVGALLVLASRAPSYRARATLVLEDTSKGAGILGELAMLGKAPQAASQIEILRARSIADETVARAPQGQPELANRNLGLTTLVDDPLLKPLNEMFFADEPDGKLPPRLKAFIECDDEFDSLRGVQVEFLAADRVAVSALGLRASVGLSKYDTVEAQVGPTPIEFGGARLHLEPEGDLSGRTFRLTRLTREEAAARLMQATRVRETERNSGVIELSVDDSDPRRAADIANALCRNYLARGENKGVDRASRTIAFIEEQLEKQNESLRDAENEVVELRRSNPLSLNVGKAGETLIEQMAELELQRMQLALAKVSVEQALERLGAGDLEALSRIQVEIGDPISGAYFQALAQLSAEHALQERSDTGALKMRMQEQALTLETGLELRSLDLETLRAALAAFDAGDRDVLSRLGGGPPSARDPLLEGHLSTLGELQSREAHFAARTTPDHPDRKLLDSHIDELCARIRILLAARVEGLEAQVADQRALLADYRARIEDFPLGERGRIEQSLAQLRERTAKHLGARLEGLGASEDAIGRHVARLEAQLGELPEEARRVADPSRRLSAHTEIVKFLLGKQQEAEITRASTSAAADFIDIAVPPVRRSGPSAPLHLAAGLLLGLVAAFGFSIVKESLVRGVFTAAELETATGLPVVGSIPDFRHGRYRVKHATEFFLPLRDDPEGPTAEALRSMRATLKYALSDGDTRVIAATSCAQGEGKSSTNIALAELFARSGRRVLLVDCDMRRPSLDKYLKAPLTPGLSDVLQGRLEWRDALRKNIDERLDLLCAGAQPANPGDLLESERFGQLLDAARAEYDLVVCDMPPAFAVSDLESAAARIDALLLVVRCNKVPARAVGEATQRLQRSGVKLIGAVLNGVGVSIANGRYGYGYGYGYGQRSGADKRAG
jgi:capsular exopolysaccharide synthesis family protein